MKMKRLAVIALVVLSLSCAAMASREASVRFNSRGITGYIRFTELENGSIQIVANLQGLRGSHNWHVHNYPVDQSLDPAVQCLGTQVGGFYNPLGVDLTDSNYATNCQNDQSSCAIGDLETKLGPLPMSGQLTGVDTSGLLALSGRYSIVGRPVIIHRENDRPEHLECGTIRLNEELEGAPVTLLQATFISPIAGTIYMRQVRSENVEIFGSVEIFGKLYWVNDSDSTMMHNWHIHIRQPGEEYHVGDCDITVDGNVGPHYDPTRNGPTSRNGYSTDCTPDTPTGCEVGDLTGKLGTIDIQARPDPYRDGAFFFTDSFLNLADVVNRSIVVHVPNRGAPGMACAPLVVSENYTVTAAGAQARFILASQSSPFEDTIISGFGVANDGAIRPLPTNDLTILSPAFGPVTTDCARENVYSPYELYEGNGEDTPDRYDLGDWRNRYMSQLTANNVFGVFDMPLYGANSMAGRTMRSVLNSTSRICSSWTPPLAGSGLIRARAVFSGSDFGPIEGVIYFIQRNYGNGVLGNTLVVVDIYYSDMNLNTSGHNWHVHETPPEEGMTCVDSIGGHYNPFSVSLGDLADAATFSDYGDDCSPTYPLRCESGDLSGKHGQLRITSDGPNYPTYVYISPNLRLNGEYSIIGRSIGLHNITGPLFDCAPVNMFALSTNTLPVEVDAGQFTRNELARALTAGTSVSLSDVFIAGGQYVFNRGGVECISFFLRILGDTQSEADANYNAVSANAASMSCSGTTAAATAVVVAPMLLLMCLLVALFSLS